MPLNRPRPFFTQPPSPIYHRFSTSSASLDDDDDDDDDDDGDDAAAVDASLPSTPVQEEPRANIKRRARAEDTKAYAWERLNSDHDEEGSDDRQCRICFGGAEDEEVLGRLISPCLCAGSMRVGF